MTTSQYNELGQFFTNTWAISKTQDLVNLSQEEVENVKGCLCRRGPVHSKEKNKEDKEGSSAKGGSKWGE